MTRSERQSCPSEPAAQAARRWPKALLLLSLVGTVCGLNIEPGGLGRSCQAQGAGEIRGERITPLATNVATTAKPPVAASTNATPVSAPASPARKAEDYLSVGFDKLAGYRFDESDVVIDGRTDPLTSSLKTAEQIPAAIKALNGKAVSVTGFMLPLKVEGGLITEFFLLRNQGMCCYGTAPKINEWVSVGMAGKGVKPVMDQPVAVTGTLHVGETREKGLLIGIYKLDGERMVVP